MFLIHIKKNKIHKKKILLKKSYYYLILFIVDFSFRCIRLNLKRIPDERTY
jgi:hypothetical protein